MKLYELNYLISSDLTESEASKLQEEIISFIQEKGGTLGKIKNPTKTELGCPIKKKKMANLITLSFDFDPSNLAELEEKLKKDPAILRYLILTKKLPKKRPEILFKKALPKVPKEEIGAKVAPERREKVDLKELEEKLKEILGE